MSDRHVIVEDEILAAGFTQIPNQVLRRSDLPPGAKLTYMVLLSYAWQKDHAYPGQDRLAVDMGVSERSVRTYLDQLVTSGFISIRRRGLGMTNVYIIHRLSRPEISADQGRPEEFADQDRKQAATLEPQDFPQKKTQVKKTQDKNGDSNIRKINEYYDKDREALQRIVADFARELGDTAPLPSTLSRTVNLFHSSNRSLDEFIEIMYSARAKTQEYSANIKSTSTSGLVGAKTKIPYFFSVLDDLLKG